MKRRAKDFRGLALLASNSYAGQAISFLFIFLLIRNLGIDDFGVYAVCLAYSAIGSVITDHGISSVLQPRVSAGILSPDTAKANIRWTKIWAVLGLGVLGYFLYLTGTISYIHYVALMIGALSVFEESWLLQAQSRFSSSVLADLVARVITLLSWLIFTINLVPSVEIALTSLAIGYLFRSVYTALLTRGLGRLVQRPLQLRKLYRLCLPIFGSRILTSVATQFTAVLYSAKSDYRELGTFAAAEKPIRATQAAAFTYGVFAQPLVAQNLRHPKFKAYVYRHLAYSFFFGLSFFVGCSFLAPFITEMLLASTEPRVVDCVRILSLIPLFTATYNFVAVAVTPLLEKTNLNLISSAVASIILVSAVLFLPGNFSAIQMAIISAVAEASILIVYLTYMIFFFRKNH